MKDERRPSETGLASSVQHRAATHLLQPVPGYDEHALDLDDPVGPDRPGRPAQRPQQDGGGLARNQVGRPRRLQFLCPLLSRHAHRDHGRPIGHRPARLVPARDRCHPGPDRRARLISAVDTLARAIGDPEEPRLKTAREIAAGGVLVAAVGSGAVTVIVLSWKFAELFNGNP